MNQKIFLSGGMTGLSKQEASQWRQDIIIRSKYYPNLSFINPTDYFVMVSPSQAYEREAMKFDLHHLLKSDIVIVNFNALHSIGTAQEIALAYYNHIPIIGLCEGNKILQLHPWYKEECTKIFEYDSDNYYETIDTLLYYITKHYTI